MFKVISCLAYEHDYSYVAIAAIVCVMSSIMTVRLFDRARRLSTESPLSWTILSAMAGGVAIWTTHFVAMLGFRIPMDHAFNPVLTIASLLIAIAFTAGGLYLSMTRIKGLPSESGGMVIGLGIIAMHFTGMAGLQVAGHIQWEWHLVAMSMLFALGFGALTAHLLTRHDFPLSRPLAMLTLVLGICSMHFTAMAAATLVPDPSVSVSVRMLSSDFLAVLVLAAMAVITGLALYVLDTHTQRELLDSFRHAATHDALTGLPNRAFLSTYLPQILSEGRADGTGTAVFVIDLDRFKEINDVHGHHSGDLLLRSLAERFTRILGPGEVIARVGGDEFVAVKRHVRSREEPDGFARRLIACVNEPLEQGANVLTVGASVGISLYPGDFGDAEELIGAADLAMYRAKRSIGARICYYEPSMDEGRRARSALAMELRHAIERNELELHYQPQLDLHTGTVNGYEALLRWRHARHGIISPADFIPIAEETGLIIPIGEWVLKTACAEVAGWRRPYRVAVNVASAQLTQVDLPRIVHETLLATGLPAARLELEITEASIIEDRDRTLHVVRQLKALGVTLAMDDYGTGYSSLSTLQVFPFDKVKIDRSFISGLVTDPTSIAIVKATILLASSLRIAVLAEGVERQEQAEFLRAEGCAEVQGFLFGRPQPPRDIAEQVGRSEGPQQRQIAPAAPAFSAAEAA